MAHDGQSEDTNGGAAAPAAGDFERATRDILQIISDSRDDEGPVFAAVLQKSAEICRADLASLQLINQARTHFFLAAYWGHEPIAFSKGEKWPLDWPHPVPEAMRTAQCVNIADFTQTELFQNGDPVVTNIVEKEGVRSRLVVPLLLKGNAVGAVSLSRKEVRPFSEPDIQLIETFAAQAVIAIENVRQFREMQTQLERETATSEVLSIIGRSRDDDMPVFDTILRNSARLCNASQAFMSMVNDAMTHVAMVAHFGDTRISEFISNDWFALDSGEPLLAERVIQSGQILNIDDLTKTVDYQSGNRFRVHAVDVDGMRSILGVPLTSNGKTIGAICIQRRETGLFDTGVIALIETFAAQAVIAIENVRQFREVQTRLEREAATREILQVISKTRGSYVEVFERVVQRAQILGGAKAAWLFLLSDDGQELRMVAQHGASAFVVDLFERKPPRINDEEGAIGSAVRTASTIQIEDIRQTKRYQDGTMSRRKAADKDGIRSTLHVPLITRGGCVGVLALHRQETGKFSDDVVRLVQSFAEQAVIAIENVRQFREVQTRLEREKASAEILSVISRSRDDEAPVLDAIVRNAARLCDAQLVGLSLADAARTHLRYASVWGPSYEYFHKGFEFDLNGPLQVSRTVREARVIHTPDLADDPLYIARDPVRAKVVEEAGVRTFLTVPLIKDGVALGCLNLNRTEVNPFSNAEIVLLETFAAQAVIAIENVRQFREVQERLEREAATKNILRVISESPDDETPTFEAILDSVTRLCDTPYASLVLGREGDDAQVMVAHRHSTLETQEIYRDGRVPMDPEDSLGAQAILECRTIHVPDMAETEQYRSGHARFVLVVDHQGIRTNLFVPLITPTGGIGCFILWKKEPAPFTDDQIALVETFAAHAVIAIENVRQFKALEELNAELGDRVEAQVGEIERMGRLKRFLPAAVADTVVSKGSDKMLSSHRALLGVLFCDIREFTAFCETAEPEETIEVLQTYHQEMGRLINDHGAGVDHRSGDGIMVLFNDPLPCDDPAGDAVRLGVAMRARMAELSTSWKRLGHRLGFGVGVSLGYATVGMVGYEGRYDYTASGTAVNLAARLCDQAVDGEILLSPRAAIAVEGDFGTECAGELDLKGIREPVEVFRLLTPDNA